MAELTTLARPYAKAAFEVALADDALEQWSEALATVAAISGQEKVSALLTNPALSAEQAASTIIEVCGDTLDEKSRNFISLLAVNKRLLLLPEVAQLFEVFKANQQKSVDVEITTAFEISSETAESLANALKNRLQREINLSTAVDGGLLGGAVIRAGDTVIDSSIRGKLSKLAESMNS